MYFNCFVGYAKIIGEKFEWEKIVRLLICGKVKRVKINVAKIRGVRILIGMDFVIF